MSATTDQRVRTAALALVVPIVAAVVAAITLLVTSAPGTGGTIGANSVTIKNFSYSPTPLMVKAGTKVTVTNADGTTHTLTADDKRFDTGKLNSGAKATITIDAPGRYAYHCDIHNYMTGLIEAK